MIPDSKAQPTAGHLGLEAIAPLHASRAKIDAAAERLAINWGFEPGSDISKWVESKLGGRVLFEYPGTDLEYGYLRVPGGKSAILDIVLSPFSGDFSRRFTVAHELGHYFLHCLAQGRAELIVRREGNNRAETEANWFAEGFLMPRTIFVKAWNEVEGSVPALMHRFKVAADVISMRRQSLIELGENGLCYEGKWA